MFRWRRRAGEQSEDWRRGLGPPVELRKDLFDHRRIFNARDHFHRATTVSTDLDINLEHALQPLRLRLIATWAAGVGSLAVPAPRRPRRDGVPAHAVGDSARQSIIMAPW